MVRPRRPAKRKVASRKIVKRAKKPVTRKPRAVPDWTAEDAAVFDVPRPPDGFAYQWSPLAAAFRMELRGWTRVPFSRHSRELEPSLNFDGYVVYRDMALFQIGADLVNDALAAERAKVSGLGSANEALDALMRQHKLGNERSKGFCILSPSFVAETAYDRVPSDAPSVPVVVSLTFRAPPKWLDAAAALGLSIAEYTRRRFSMDDTLLLGADVDGTFSPYELTTRKAD